MVPEPEFSATGVRIGRRLRSLTRGGQVLVRDGRLVLLTSRGREIDSAPAEAVRAIAAKGFALASLNGVPYLLNLRRRGSASLPGLLDSLRGARERASAAVRPGDIPH